MAAAALYKLVNGEYWRVADDGQSRVKVTNATARAVDNAKYGPTIVLTSGEPELAAWVASVPTTV